MGFETKHGEVYDTKTPKWVIAQAQKVTFLRNSLEQGLTGRKTILGPSQADLKPTLSALTPNNWFVYVGVGSGHLTQAVQEATTARVLGIDIDDLRTPTTQDTRFTLANGRELPLTDNSVDGLSLLYVLHLTERPEELIQEAVRVVRPGGKIILIEDTLSKPPTHPWSLWAVRTMNLLTNTQRVWSPKESYHSTLEWQQMLIEAGCEANIDTKTWHWNLLDLINQGYIWRGLKGDQYQATRFITTKRVG